MGRFFLGVSLFLSSLATAATSEISERAATPLPTVATLTTGASVFLFGGRGYPGLSVNFSGNLGRGVFVGIETGVGYREPLSVTPVLATIEWRIRAPFLRPYVGAGIGGVVEWGRNITRWRLALLAKPGVELAFAKTVALRLEPRIGFFGRDFVFAPVVGVTVSL